MKYAIAFFPFLFLSTSFFAQYDSEFSKIEMLYSDFSMQSHDFLKDNKIDINEANKLNKILESINSAEAQFINTKNGLSIENESKLVYLNAKQNIIDSIADLFYKTTIELTICNNESIVNIPEILHLDYLSQEVYGFDLIDKFSKLVKTIDAVIIDKTITNFEMNMVNTLSADILDFKLTINGKFSDHDSKLKLLTFFDSQCVIIDSLFFQLSNLTIKYNSLTKFRENNIPDNFFFQYRGLEHDALKMLSKIVNYTFVSLTAANDKRLNDSEISELKLLGEDLVSFEEFYTVKYKSDAKGKADFDKFQELNKALCDKIYEDFFASQMELYECEGADKLE